MMTVLEPTGIRIHQTWGGGDDRIRVQEPANLFSAGLLACLQLELFVHSISACD